MVEDEIRRPVVDPEDPSLPGGVRLWTLSDCAVYARSLGLVETVRSEMSPPGTREVELIIRSPRGRSFSFVTAVAALQWLRGYEEGRMSQ